MAGPAGHDQPWCGEKVRGTLIEDRRRRAAKRGGGHVPLALDIENAEGRYLREPPDATTPEALFDRPSAVLCKEEYLTDPAARCARCDCSADSAFPLAPKQRIIDILGYC